VLLFQAALKVRPPKLSAETAREAVLRSSGTGQLKRKKRWAQPLRQRVQRANWLNRYSMSFRCYRRASIRRQWTQRCLVFNRNSELIARQTPSWSLVFSLSV
jgi:hypothetical protein